MKTDPCRAEKKEAGNLATALARGKENTGLSCIDIARAARGMVFRAVDYATFAPLLFLTCEP
jgi:hypothetical protein